MDRAEFAREEAQAAGLPDCAEWRLRPCGALRGTGRRRAQADRGGGPEPGLVHARQSPALEAAGLALLRARGVPRAVQALFAGEAVNWTEDKPAWHTALRAGRTREQPDSQDAGSVCEYARMLDFVRALDQEADIGAVLHIGIGGSDWGPRLAVQAFGGPAAASDPFRFEHRRPRVQRRGGRAEALPGGGVVRPSPPPRPCTMPAPPSPGCGAA